MTDVQVIHASALDFDAAFFAEFDIQVTDFPYSDHVHDSCTSVGTGGAGVRARDLGFASLSPELRGAGVLCAASVKRWSVLFSDWQSAHQWDMARSAAAVEPVRWVPWVRWSQPQLSGDRPCTGSEAVLVYHRAEPKKSGGFNPIRKRWNGPGSLTDYESDCVCRDFLPGLDARALRGQDKHPTEKPLDLILDLVSSFSDPGENVIDLCAGSGTTALACLLLERGCVAIELQEQWAIRGKARLDDPLKGSRDGARAQEWVERVIAEASAVPEPRAADGSDVKTWERAQRRLEDAARVAARL